MNYNKEESNRYPQNQNGYRNNVPKPTFSGVMGKDNPSDIHFQNSNMYNNQSQFGFPNYQMLNSYQPNPVNYTNSYNNYQNPNNSGMIYYPPTSYQPSGQLTNNMFTTPFQNDQQAWSYSKPDKRPLYQGNGSDNLPTNDIGNDNHRDHESNQNKRQIISYEDVVPGTQKHNKKQKKQQKSVQQKQTVSMDHGTPGCEGHSFTRSEINRNESRNDNKNKHKFEEERSKSLKEEPIQKKSSLIHPKEKQATETHKGEIKEVKGGMDDEDDEDDEENNNNKDSVNIQGTSIKLDTDEEIAKWKEERRKMWLLKISNKKEEHMKAMGIKEVDLKNTSVLNEAKKQKKFIQSIESQVHRYEPNANLNIKVVQRGMSVENDKILQFIQELGDVGLLTYELTEEEKDKLFGGTNSNNNNGRRPFRNNKPYGNSQKKRFEPNRRYQNNKR